MAKDFQCACKGCGKSPEFGKTEIWIQGAGGMLCESCWRATLQKNDVPSTDAASSEHEFCCFCAICKRTPPDPEYKIWIETDKGCLCEKCWRETIGNLISQKTESSPGVEKGKGPVDIQFGCCLINKKLLIKTLDALPSGEYVLVIAENSDAVKSTVNKYVKDKGCTITEINDQNGTSIITIRRPG